jgi:ribonuclease E
MGSRCRLLKATSSWPTRHSHRCTKEFSMAAVSFPLTAAVQDLFQAAEPAQQAAAKVTPINANQAQGAPAPADTVTLTNQAAEGQQTGADPNRGHFDRAAFLGAAAAYIGTNAARPNRQAPQPTLPLLPPQPQTQPQAQTQEAPAATAAAPANTAANTAANTPTNAGNTANAAANTIDAATATNPAATGSDNTPQQQLQQLDQSLQQLGINPQSIPLFNRMAMLLYASDPAALRLLVQTIQGAATQQGAAQTANTAGNVNQAAVQTLLPATTPANQGQPAAPAAANATAVQTPTQPTNSSLGQAAPAQGQPSQGTEQIDVIAAQINFTEAQATFEPTQAAPTQPTVPANTAASAQSAQPSTLTVQIEELQVAFQTVEIQQGSQQLDGSSAPEPPGTSLNVTA